MFQVIEHSDANGKRAVFLDNMRVKARETKTVLTLEKVHLPAPASDLVHVHRTAATRYCGAISDDAFTGPRRAIWAMGLSS